MLGLGANKGLHGVALFMNAPSSVIAKAPIRHLADFKGKKIRVLASPFQEQPIARLGATPVAMTLGDVVPAMQQGAIDGAIGGIVVWTPMHFNDAAKYVTETGQPAVYVIVEVSKTWYDLLPADLQTIIDKDAAAEQAAIIPTAAEIVSKARKGWTDNGGELISLPADEQAELMKTFCRRRRRCGQDQAGDRRRLQDRDRSGAAHPVDNQIGPPAQLQRWRRPSGRKTMKPKIAIVGAGAVGGYTGAHMVQAGEDVTFIDPWPAHVEHMRQHGLRVTHAMTEPEFTVPVRALHVTDAQ